MAHVFTEANFQAEVLSSSAPVAVDFWAVWCPPCRITGPIIDELSQEIDESKLKIGKLNVDENSHLSTEYRVLSIPTVIIFKDGKEVERLVGAMPKEAFLEKFKSYTA
jgi:thioredoxin 1